MIADKNIDDTIEASFPASDPPAWNGISGVGSLDSHPSTDYNYLHFSADHYRFHKDSLTEIGDFIPDFSLLDLSGKEVLLSELCRSHSNVVIEVGSLTCPAFVDKISTMNDLQDTFAGSKFVVMYVREAHPGAKIKAHKNIKEKIAAANRLEKEHDESRTVLVDQVNGKNHELFGCMPNACFLIGRDLKLIYKSHWTTPDDIKTLLSGLTLSACDAPLAGHVFPEWPHLSTLAKTFSKAGSGSLSDFAKSLPGILSERHRVKKHLRDFRPQTSVGSCLE